MHDRMAVAGFLALFLMAGNASAAVFCVATSSAIRQALIVAGSNGEADTIRIIIGTYSAPSGAIAFPYTSNENNAITLEGGYTFGCGVRVDKAYLTVLSGSGVRQVMRFYSQGNGTVSVKNLTIADGDSAATGAGLSIEGPTGEFFLGFKGSAIIERVVFLGNRSDAEAGGLRIATRGGNMTVRGSLFGFNRCGESHCAVWLENSDSSPDTVLFGGNTVALNTCSLGAPLCESGGARFSGEQNAVIYDNLFALNSNEDLLLEDPEVEADLYYNNIDEIAGSPDTEIGTLNVANPEFLDALAEDFRLKPTSPLRNKGNAPFPLPSVDLDGRQRIVESAPDLGAYEIPDDLFVDGFDEE